MSAPGDARTRALELAERLEKMDAASRRRFVQVRHETLREVVDTLRSRGMDIGKVESAFRIDDQERADQEIAYRQSQAFPAAQAPLPLPVRTDPESIVDEPVMEAWTRVLTRFERRVIEAVKAVPHAEACPVRSFDPMGPAPQAAPICSCDRDERIGLGAVAIALECIGKDTAVVDSIAAAFIAAARPGTAQGGSRWSTLIA